MAFTAIFFSSSNSPLSFQRSRFLDSHFTHLFSHDSISLNFSRRFSQRGISLSSTAAWSAFIAAKISFRDILFASSNGMNAVSSSSLKSELDGYSVPMPIVLIDRDSDSDATIVQLSFGDRLGALIDTMKALKELGLDVSKGIVSTEGPIKQTKFFITLLDIGLKVEDPDLLERIRLTIINNLLKYYPESSEQLAMGGAFGIQRKNLLYMETAYQPGLLIEIIKIISDVNIDVESAEIETEVLVNCLRYYL